MKSHATLIGGSFWTPKITKISGDSKPRAIHDTNFETTQSIPPSMQFSRLSAATYFKNNVLTDAVIDEARFESAGLLVEKQSTNEVSISHALNSFSAFSGSVLDVVAANIPEANLSGFRCKTTGGTVTLKALTISSASLAAGVIRTFSAFFKNLSAVPIRIGHQLDNDQMQPNAYLRYKVTRAHTAVWTGFFQATTNAVPDSTDFLYAHLQREALLYASSIIKTNGSPTTRSADVLTIKATNQSILIKYKRQDTDAIEKQIVDAVSDHMLNLAVGCHLQRVKVFNRILTTEEKTQELANV